MSGAPSPKLVNDYVLQQTLLDEQRLTGKDVHVCREVLKTSARGTYLHEIFWNWNVRQRCKVFYMYKEKKFFFTPTGTVLKSSTCDVLSQKHGNLIKLQSHKTNKITHSVGSENKLLFYVVV